MLFKWKVFEQPTSGVLLYERTVMKTKTYCGMERGLRRRVGSTTRKAAGGKWPHVILIISTDANYYLRAIKYEQASVTLFVSNDMWTVREAVTNAPTH